MLTVHKINACNCLFLSLLFLSFLSHFLHWIFFHFLYCVKTDSSLVRRRSPVTRVWISGIEEHWEQRRDLGYHTHTAAFGGNTDSCSRQQIPHIQAAPAVWQICCPNSQCASSMPDAIGHSGQLVWLKWPVWKCPAIELPGQSDSSHQAAPAVPDK